jgi:hypothetical protein
MNYFIQQKVPQMYEKLHEMFIEMGFEGLQEQYVAAYSFLQSWIGMMFTDQFPIDMTLNLLDKVLESNEHFIFKVALAILKCVNEKLDRF